MNIKGVWYYILYGSLKEVKIESRIKAESLKRINAFEGDWVFFFLWFILEVHEWDDLPLVE